MNTLLSENFSEPYPARTTVVTEMVVDGLLIEIEALAIRRLAEPNRKSRRPTPPN
jgi:enamine deaminase RidA (YjgF/YER057c/UK114 family)